MARERFILDLGRLLIAAAWSDGRVGNEELNVLKDLLFRIPELTGEEYAGLEVYMEQPVTDEERDRLLERVIAGIRSDADRRLVIRTLTDMVEADGTVTDEERNLLDSVRTAVERKGTGLLSSLAGIFSGAVRKRTAPAGGPREQRVDDYIRNTIYFQLTADRERRGAGLDLPDEKVRKLCLAAGLMAKVAWVDAEIGDREKAAMRTEVGRLWGLSEEESALVVDMSLSQVARGLDHFRVCRGFFEATSPGERREFLECLFRIAKSCGKVSHAEIVEIRRIADSIKVPHDDFIAAKLTIPAADRGGL